MLCVNVDGMLVIIGYFEVLGLVLIYKWIIMDFVEVLLEFIMLVDGDIQYMFIFMCDFYWYMVRKLGDEWMWLLSMFCYIVEGQDIELVQYGILNIGCFKMFYCEGLKNCYGVLM